MRNLRLILVLLFATTPLYAQNGDFPFGKISAADLQLTTYSLDSSAVAVVLSEFGQAYLDNENDNNLLFDHHVRIKILKQEGLKLADVELALYKTDNREERLRTVRASSFNQSDNGLVESPVANKSIFTENRENADIKKFAIPNVRVGSIIEFVYTIESPFIYKFRTWEFQSDIPKMYSEFWAKIPANYLYNITLKGYLKLTKNESKLEKNCFDPGGGNRADCSLFMYGMKNVPAFVEEDFMTAKSNFVSAINFELAEIRTFDGQVRKYTEEWRDAEMRMKRYPDFGQQLKKADGIMSEAAKLVSSENDPLQKATMIYNHMVSTYSWNGKLSMVTDEGVKRVFETKVGNSAELNFLLIGALQAAGFDAEPVILSTRANGLATELHPVISDFNYVVARVTINGKSVLLDATDPFHPFGLLPERCLNGKGRVISDKTSYWIDLKPSEKAKRVSTLQLKLTPEGSLKGIVQTTYQGYEAVKMRKEISRFDKHQDFINSLSEKVPGMEITKFEIENHTEPSKPLAVNMEISFQVFDESSADNFLFSPFLFNREKENPFKSMERIYPVDFGSPREIVTVFNLDYPEQFEIANRPEPIALSLPNAGGRYLFQATIFPSKLTISHSLLINKSVFPSEEYKYLRELYSRIIQVHNEDLIFKKKT